MEFWAERGVGGGAGGASAIEFWVEVGEGGGRGVRRQPVRRRGDDETSGAQAKLMHRVRGRWWEVGGSR